MPCHADGFAPDLKDRNKDGFFNETAFLKTGKQASYIRSCLTGCRDLVSMTSMSRMSQYESGCSVS